jgi:hypothetical protein
MKGRGRFVALAGVLVATVGGTYALASGDDQHASSRDTTRQGLIARLPYVGTLTWRCDDEQRFFTELRLPKPGATVFVSVTADGVPVWRGRQVNPKPAPEPTRAVPPPALRTQTWTIRYHHMPATAKVVVRLRFAAPRPEVECLVSHAAIDVRRTPH